MSKGDGPMAGKTCIVTGATSGIGRVIAGELARQGATLVVVGRNREKAAATVEAIRRRTGNPSVAFMLADLSSLEEVRRLAEEFNAGNRPLHVLVNNAGAITLSRRLTVDGIEMTFALNHLSYFLLANLLLDRLKSGGRSRIVNVSSDSHKNAWIEFENLQGERAYSAFRAYGLSKLCNLLFTYEMARRLQGSELTVNALHPGLIATNLLANNGAVGRVMNLLLRVVGGSVEKGARTGVYLATSPEVEGVSGKYFVRRAAVPSSQASYDDTAARRLWEVSAELTGL